MKKISKQIEAKLQAIAEKQGKNIEFVLEQFKKGFEVEKKDHEKSKKAEGLKEKKLIESISKTVLDHMNESVNFYVYNEYVEDRIQEEKNSKIAIPDSSIKEEEAEQIYDKFINRLNNELPLYYFDLQIKQLYSKKEGNYDGLTYFNQTWLVPILIDKEYITVRLRDLRNYPTTTKTEINGYKIERNQIEDGKTQIRVSQKGDNNIGIFVYPSYLYPNAITNEEAIKLFEQNKPENMEKETNYYKQNEDGKFELHFDFETYKNLSDEDKKEIKSYFLFSRNKSAWISKSKDGWRAKKIADKNGLQFKGKDKKLSFKEEMQKKERNAEYKIEKYEVKKDKAESRAEQLQSEFNRLRKDWSWLTQPIIRGHSGSERFGRSKAKVLANYEAGFQEYDKAKYYATKKELAADVLNKPELKNIKFVQNRIKDAETTIRKVGKWVEDYQNKLNNDTDISDVQKNKLAEYIEDGLQKLTYAYDKLAYYKLAEESLLETNKGGEITVFDKELSKELAKYIKKYFNDVYKLKTIKVNTSSSFITLSNSHEVIPNEARKSIALFVYPNESRLNDSEDVSIGNINKYHISLSPKKWYDYLKTQGYEFNQQDSIEEQLTSDEFEKIGEEIIKNNLEPMSLQDFNKIVLESKDENDAYEKISKIKNVPASVADEFYNKYGQQGVLDPKQAFHEYYMKVMKENNKEIKYKTIPKEVLKFMPIAQQQIVNSNITEFQDAIENLLDLISKLPKTYGTEGQGDNAIAYLHYFYGSSDWYITEQDIEEEQIQAFGLADMGFAEMGYINIEELKSDNRIELDFYWIPKAIKEIRKKEEVENKIEPTPKKFKTMAAQTANAVKAELKEKFPNIKFSVSSKSYSGGDSVRISYTDAVPLSEVDKITSKYQYGEFNGMEDIYENTNSRNDIPQTKYLFVEREMSQQAKDGIVQQLIKDWGEGFSQLDDYERNRMIRDVFMKTDYLNPIQKQESEPIQQPEKCLTFANEFKEQHNKSVIIENEHVVIDKIKHFVKTVLPDQIIFEERKGKLIEPVSVSYEYSELIEMFLNGRLEFDGYSKDELLDKVLFKEMLQTVRFCEVSNIANNVTYERDIKIKQLQDEINTLKNLVDEIETEKKQIAIEKIALKTDKKELDEIKQIQLKTAKLKTKNAVKSIVTKEKEIMEAESINDAIEGLKLLLELESDKKEKKSIKEALEALMLLKELL